ncbi:hypothetical protein GCM10008106_28180 [Mongoliitalea lutea]|uniref:Uncharacterized protein n=2 Tax=Mongoliitalea lutea TaxID=849756 RepID=A0A8J3D1F7_9BACT|nr:hypothetical protein GCM10008106_28180 [Mongoliitalea lutea]
MLAVLLMAAGINYSLYRYLKTTSPTQSEKSRMNILGQFEKKSTLARPLRWTGLILFAIHLAVWLELLNFAYSNYVGLTALVVLFAYIVLAALFFKREIQ